MCYVWKRGEVRTGFWWGRLDGKRPLEIPRHSWKDIIEMDLMTWDGGHGLDCCGLGQGQVAGACERSNECSGSIEFGEFLD
jgi:hypothetical protein